MTGVQTCALRSEHVQPGSGRGSCGRRRVTGVRHQHTPGLGRAKGPSPAPHRAELALPCCQGAGLPGPGLSGHCQPRCHEKPAHSCLRHRISSPVAHTRLCMACHPHTHTHTHSPSPSHAHSHLHTHSHTLTHTLSHTPSHTLTHTHPHARTHSHTESITVDTDPQAEKVKKADV